MYAVIKSGGKQYRVESGKQVRVEALAADVGAAVAFEEVLLVGTGDRVKVGAPLVSGAKVKATVVVARPRREGEDLQDAPAQALPEIPGTSAELHRGPHRRHRTGIGKPWHTRKQAAARATGATRKSKRLGVKVYGGEHVNAGQILVRQRGTQGASRHQRRHRPRPHAVSRASTGQVQYAVRGADQKNTVSVLAEKAPA